MRLEVKTRLDGRGAGVRRRRQRAATVGHFFLLFFGSPLLYGHRLLCLGGFFAHFRSLFLVCSVLAEQGGLAGWLETVIPWTHTHHSSLAVSSKAPKSGLDSFFYSQHLYDICFRGLYRLSVGIYRVCIAYGGGRGRCYGAHRVLLLTPPPRAKCILQPNCPKPYDCSEGKINAVQAVDNQSAHQGETLVQVHGWVVSCPIRCLTRP